MRLCRAGYKWVPYDRLFMFSVNTRKASIVMCHPGIVDELIAKDPLLTCVRWNTIFSGRSVYPNENMNFEIKLSLCFEAD